MKLIVTTHPFGHTNDAPIRLLNENKIDFSLNKIGRKYSNDELITALLEERPDVIIAGTEEYDKTILDLIPNLRMISRVGIGLDNIPFKECKERKIVVTYTPDAPSNAVAELTICQILNMLRKVQNVSNDMMNKEKWNRYIGRELKHCKVGIIGFGRVGKLVHTKLSKFGCELLINDIDPMATMPYGVTNYHYIYNECDVITIHIPLKDNTVNNNNFISSRELSLMKCDVRLLNMSRGGIINEEDLYQWLKEHPKATVAIDAFKQEPYREKLSKLGNTYLTPHLGSCTTHSRLDMEVGAVEEVINFMNNKSFNNRVV